MSAHHDMPRAAIFEAVARHGSFTAAARSLGLSKGSVSSQVRLLEQHLGTTLFLRSTRSVRLTAEGERFLPHAEAMVAAWALAQAAVQSDSTALTGSLRVTAPAYLADPLVFPAIQRVRLDHPGLVMETMLDDSVVDLHAKSIDVAIRTGPLPDSTMLARRLGTDREVLVAAPALARRFGDATHPAELGSPPWVHHTLMPLSRTLTGPDGDVCVLRPSPTARCLGTRGLMFFVRQGAGLCLLPALLVAADLSAGRLVRVFPDWTGRAFGIFALTHSRPIRSARIDTFVDALSDVARGGMTGQGAW